MQHLKANLGRFIIFLNSNMKSPFAGAGGGSSPQEGYTDITNGFLVLLLLGFGFVF